VNGFGGPELDRTLLALAGFAVAVCAFLLARRVPRLAFVGAIAVICFVPIWIGVAIGFNGNLFVPLAVVTALATSVAMLPLPRFQLSPMDGMLAFLLVVAGSALLTGNTTIALSFLITPFTYFVSGYALGRLGASRIPASWVHGAIAVAFSLVAVLAIVEFVAEWNPFVGIKSGNSLFAAWGGLQERGGVFRAEGAFGHSIALSSSLALAIPLTLASNFRFAIRLAMVGVMLVGTAFTFSRIGIISALLGLVLSLLFMRKTITTRMRVLTTSVAVAVAVAVFPIVDTVFAEAGAEAVNSAEYRANLLSLMRHMNFIGVSDLVRRSSSGELYFESFQSIDSQLILTGLTNGVLALAAIVAILLAALVLVLRGKATPATIAIVAQIPAFTSVALITQYSIFLWVVVGIAATAQAQARRAAVVQARPLFAPVKPQFPVRSS
jgi:hypothetical protein